MGYSLMLINQTKKPHSYPAKMKIVKIEPPTTTKKEVTTLSHVGACTKPHVVTDR